MANEYIGTVRQHESGGYGVRKADGSWFAVPGSLRAFFDFVPVFGGLFAHDAGKRVYREPYGFTMESQSQATNRINNHGDVEPAKPDTVADVLRDAESFISGFEDDDLQEGIDALLARIQAAIKAQPSS